MFQSISVFEALGIVYLVVGIMLGTLGPAGIHRGLAVCGSD